MSASGKLDAALSYAARGYAVLPLQSCLNGSCSCSRSATCASPGKHPRTAHGKDDASTDAATIRAWWKRWPDANIGVSMGASGLAGVDVDVHKGKPGMETWQDVKDEHGAAIEDTAIVETPSGGMHFWYEAGPYRIASVENMLGLGVDTKAEGGYLVVPPSSISGVEYAWAEGHGLAHLAAMPESLGERLAYLTTKPKTPAADLANGGRLVKGMPGGRHGGLSSLAGIMHNAGCSTEEIGAALHLAAANRCDPPYTDTAKIDAIARDSASWLVGKAPVHDPPAPEVCVEWSTFWNCEDVAEWLYPDVLARGRGHALYASHKMGKSLLMLYVAAKLATDVEPVVVIYLDYEMTEADVRERLEDMGFGPDSDLSRLRYDLLPTLPALDTAEGSAALMAFVDRTQDESPGHHVVVIVDTMSRAVKGAENDADTFRAFFNHTGIELKRRGVTWARLDHAGKDTERGQRGSSGKGDDVDVIWRLTSTDSGVCLHRDAARMNWVPEKVTLGLFENPLRYLPVVGAYPEGTGEVANILSRLDVPLDATAREAQAALRTVGEGRRTQIVTAALRWRRDRLADSPGVSHIPGNTLSENATETLPGTTGNNHHSEAGNTAGNSGKHIPRGRVGNVSPPYGGNSFPAPTEVPVPAVPDEHEERVYVSSELLGRAAVVVVMNGAATAALIRARCGVDRALAEATLNDLERAGVVAPANGRKARDVIVDDKGLARILSTLEGAT